MTNSLMPDPSDMTDLEEKLMTLAAYIQSFRSIHGFAPSRQEIADTMGVAGRGSAQWMLQQLKRNGMVTWTKGTSRSLILTTKALAMLEEQVPNGES